MAGYVVQIAQVVGLFLVLGIVHAFSRLGLVHPAPAAGASSRNTRQGSGCPEGFFNPSGPSSQCFKYYVSPGRTWTEAREFCILNGLKMATPNDDVNLEELSTYLEKSTGGIFATFWLGGRWSASGFRWEAGVGEQPGSSSGRRGLDGHPGWWPGSQWGPTQPAGMGNDWCLLMKPRWGSAPYHSERCAWEMSTLCQLF